LFRGNVRGLERGRHRTMQYAGSKNDIERGFVLHISEFTGLKFMFDFHETVLMYKHLSVKI
jgi:hypothetical protein